MAACMGRAYYGGNAELYDKLSRLIKNRPNDLAPRYKELYDTLTFSKPLAERGLG